MYTFGTWVRRRLYHSIYSGVAVKRGSTIIIIILTYMYITLCSVSAVYAQQEAELSQISPEDDLRLYALTFGTGMSHSWPEFEV